MASDTTSAAEADIVRMDRALEGTQRCLQEQQWLTLKAKSWLAERDQLQAQLTAANETISALKQEEQSQTQAHSERISKFHAENNQLRAQHDAVQQTNNALNTSLNEKNKELMAMQNTQKELQSTISTMQQEKDSLIATHKETLDQHIKEKQELEQQLHALKTENNQTTEDQQNKLEQAQDELIKLRQNVNEWKEKYERLQDGIKQQKSKMSAKRLRMMEIFKQAAKLTPVQNEQSNGNREQAIDGEREHKDAKQSAVDQSELLRDEEYEDIMKTQQRVSEDFRNILNEREKWRNKVRSMERTLKETKKEWNNRMERRRKEMARKDEKIDALNDKLLDYKYKAAVVEEKGDSEAGMSYLVEWPPPEWMDADSVPKEALTAWKELKNPNGDVSVGDEEDDDDDVDIDGTELLSNGNQTEDRNGSMTNGHETVGNADGQC